ncbi:MAG: hypothetical protein Q7S57_01015 [bacterium]|nr:hypothetical protein [bacterium]
MDEQNQPVVFIAGGIGIAPFYGIIEEQARLEWSRSVTLFQVEKTPKDAAFMEKLRALTNKNFTYIPTMTRLEDSDTSWDGERGRITADLIQKNVQDLCAPMYYIVGLPGMVDSVVEELAKIGVPQEKIKTELFTGY